MNKKVTSYSFLLILCFFSFFGLPKLYAQPSNYVAKVAVDLAREGEDLTLRVDLFQTNVIKSITLAYKTNGDAEYKFQEMMLMGTNAVTTIPGKSVSIPFIQYYFIIETNTAERVTHPIDAIIGGNPLMVQVQEPNPKDNEVLILSPDKNSPPIALDELFLSVSLLKASSEVDKKASRVYINDKDITDLCIISDDIIIFSGSNFMSMFAPGRNYSFTIDLFDKTGKKYHSVKSTFSTKSMGVAKVPNSEITYYANIKGESRNEEISQVNRWYNNMDIDANATYKSLDLSAKLFVTSEEKGYLQPNNRFLVTAKLGNVLDVSYGDAFPTLPSLILNGKRVRGLSGSIDVGFFTLDATLGEINRAVEGEILSILPKGTNVLGSEYLMLKDSSIAKVNYGVFKRDVFSVRPAFHVGKAFEIGFSYLHSKDDMSSIVYGARPKENAVIGIDLGSAIDEQKIQFTSQAAFSLINNDITTGTMSDETIDEVFKATGGLQTDPKQIKDIKKYVNSLITFNQFISPLNPEKLGNLAAEAALTFNYFGNYLRTSYLYRGNDYQSFGSTFLRTDVQGYSISDRLRLLENTVFVALSYESLKDNLQSTRNGTTTYNTITSSVSYLPRFDCPSVTVSYSRLNNTNDIDKTNPTMLPYLIDDATNRYSLQLSYNLHGLYETQLSLSGMYSDRNDNSVQQYNIKNTSVFLTGNTSWNSKLSTSVNASLNNTTIDDDKFNYIGLNFGGRYLLLRDDLVLNASISPSFGDIERVAFDFSSQYRLIEAVSLVFQVRYISTKGYAPDRIVGISTRYSLK